MDKLIEFKEEVVKQLHEYIGMCDKNIIIYNKSNDTEGIKAEMYRRQGLLQSIQVINTLFDKFNKGEMI